MQVVISNDAHGRGKIQASHSAPYGNGIAGIFLYYLGRKARGLLPEEQVISEFYGRFGVARSGSRAETDYSALSLLLTFQKGLKAGMVSHVHLVPVVETGPPEMTVIHAEAEGMNKVEPQFRRPAQSRNISRVIRNLRPI